RDRGRELDVGPRLQLPEAVVRRSQPLPAGSEMRPLLVVAVRRPLFLDKPGRERLLALPLLLLRRRIRAQDGRELLRGRAADIARPLLVPGPAAERRAHAEREQRRSEQRP